MKILLLEDDVMLNRAITQYLQTKNHSVRTTRDGTNCLKVIDEEDFELLILDINVPDINGFEVLEILHEKNIQIPTIFISALINIEEITKAFELGCYDYLKKPFHLKELTLRINKLSQSQIIPKQNKILSDVYSFNTNTLALLYNNIAHVLPKRQIQIIQLLARYKNTAVNYDMFRELVWQDDTIDNATIRAEINRLKKALKEDFIRNIRGLGYMIEYKQDD